MKILPIINNAMHNSAKNKVAFNKSLLIAPLLLTTATTEALARDTFSKSNVSEIIMTNSTTEFSNKENCFDYSSMVETDKNHKNDIAPDKVLRKISKLEATQSKYEGKLREKENTYNLNNTILKAMNGDKDSKNRLLEHVQDNSSKRDIGIFIGGGFLGVALSMITGPAGLLVSLASFFPITTNYVNNYVVEKKINPKQREDVVKEIKKLEDEIKDIKNDIKTIQFKISELK